MDEKELEALDILIANGLCFNYFGENKKTCEDCPMYRPGVECRDYRQDLPWALDTIFEWRKQYE